MQIRTLAYVGALCLILTGCQPGGSDSQANGPQRLVDLFADATVEGSPAETPAAEEAAWTFADGTGDWRALGGVDGLEAADGTLNGKSANDLPMLLIDNPFFEQAPDLLHAVEITARISAGTNLQVVFDSSEELIPPALEGRIRNFPFNPQTPILAGDEMQTYTLRPGMTEKLNEIRRIVVRPTDEADATFAIQSIRIIPRSTHLAKIPSGIGWHGLGEIYRETLVMRAPERSRFKLQVPSRARFEFAVGTLDERPVSFEVTVDGESIHSEALSAGDAWTEAQVDLSAYSGREVELELGVQADEPGTLALWGSPVVRDLASAEGKPSVLLIVADTLRADHLGTYGHGRETAPALNEMAGGGAVFEDCVTQGTWTKVSFSSIMSSRWPPSHGVREMPDRLPAAAVTMAEAFREAGYATMALSSIHFHGKFTNLHQGYEVFHEASSLEDDPDNDLNVKTAARYVKRFKGWIDKYHDTPFFAVLHVADPHAPFRPRAPFDTMWADAESGQRHFEEAERAAEFIKDPLMKRFKMPRTEELEAAGVDPVAYVAHETAWYDGSIRAMDEELGSLFEHLQSLGIYDNLVIAFTSDHGEEFLEHGGHWHGTTVYGVQSHVPLVFRGPGIDPGKRVPETVQSIDIMPTLLDLAGIPVPEGSQGASLKPLLAESETRWRPRPAFTTKAGFGNDAGGRLETDDVGMVAEGWKLVEKSHPSWDAPRYELYDHANDPKHLKDVAAENQEVVERLAVQLKAWREQAIAEKLDDEAALANLDSEELERLRSLGYVQ